MSADAVAQDQLQSFVRRIESVEDEINALNSDKSEIYKEAKGAGFDVKVMRKLIADRRKDASERAEFETIYELYAAALGMRLYRHEGDQPSSVRAHVENIAEFDADGVEIETPATIAGQVVTAHEPSATLPVESNATEISTPIPFVAKPLRPYCLNPGNSCGGQGKKHCFRCQKAHDEQQGVA